MPLGSRAVDALEVYLRKRPADPDRPQARDNHGVRVQVGTPALADRPLVDRQADGPIGGTTRSRQPAHPASQLRHPSARGRGRPSRRPGDARPRLDRHDPDLYPGRAEPAPAGPRPVPSAVSGLGRGRRSRSSRPTGPATDRVAKAVVQLAPDDRPIAGGVRSFRSRDADSLALMDRHDPDNLAVLICEECDPDVADERGVVPMATIGTPIGKIEHRPRACRRRSVRTRSG